MKVQQRQTNGTPFGSVTGSLVYAIPSGKLEEVVVCSKNASECFRQRYDTDGRPLGAKRRVKTRTNFALNLNSLKASAKKGGGKVTLGSLAKTRYANQLSKVKNQGNRRNLNDAYFKTVRELVRLQMLNTFVDDVQEIVEKDVIQIHKLLQDTSTPVKQRRVAAIFRTGAKWAGTGVKYAWNKVTFANAVALFHLIMTMYSYFNMLHPLVQTTLLNKVATVTGDKKAAVFQVAVMATQGKTMEPPTVQKAVLNEGLRIVTGGANDPLNRVIRKGIENVNIKKRLNNTTAYLDKSNDVLGKALDGTLRTVFSLGFRLVKQYKKVVQTISKKPIEEQIRIIQSLPVSDIPKSWFQDISLKT